MSTIFGFGRTFLGCLCSTEAQSTQRFHREKNGHVATLMYSGFTPTEFHNITDELMLNTQGKKREKMAYKKGCVGILSYTQFM
jgi:hypothetical protein